MAIEEEKAVQQEIIMDLQNSAGKPNDPLKLLCQNGRQPDRNHCNIHNTKMVDFVNYC